VYGHQGEILKSVGFMGLAQVLYSTCTCYKWRFTCIGWSGVGRGWGRGCSFPSSNPFRNKKKRNDNKKEKRERAIRLKTEI